MINIKDQLFVEIKIDGQSVTGGNLVSSIALLEGAPVIAPSMVMILNDHSHKLTETLCLTDANQIVVTTGKTPDDLKTVSRQYRVFGVHTITGQSGPQLKVLGIYDAPDYTTKCVSESYDGPSTNVIKQIAEKCKLDYDGPEDFNGRTTSDNQIWLTLTKTRGAFVQHDIAKYGYMDDSSAMYACLTSLGVLKYRNIMDVISKSFDEIPYVFAHNIEVGDQDSGKQLYLVAQARERSQAGLMNMMHNYGSTMIVDGTAGETQVETKVDVKSNAKYLAINNQVSQTVERTRISYGPLDCGNVHDKFYRAEYQNIKQLALFSERQSLIVTEPTEVQLLDPVIYKQADEDPARPVKVSDVYVVIGKTVFITGFNYCERIELARMSLTEEGESNLKSSEPTSARESSLPETTIDPSATVAANSVTKAASIMSVVGPIESAVKSATDKAAKLLNNLSLTQPSLMLFGRNMGSYLEKPAQAMRDIKAAAASVSLLKSTASELKSSVENAITAVKSGNAQMISDGLSAVTRSAAQFRPNGFAENYSALLGPVQVLKTAAESYKSISTNLQSMKAALNAAEGIGSQIDAITGDMNSIVSDYRATVSAMGRGYNAMIEAVTGESPKLSVPNIETNRYFFEELLKDSISMAEAPMESVAYRVKTVNDIQRSIAQVLTQTDDTRNYSWVPESGYSVATLPVSKLSDNVQKMGNFLESADSQFNEFLDSRS